MKFTLYDENGKIIGLVSGKDQTETYDKMVSLGYWHADDEAEILEEVGVSRHYLDYGKRYTRIEQER